MANFKAPVAPLFNGDQFELNGNVISGKGGSFNIVIEPDTTAGKYKVNHTAAEINTAVTAGQDINIKFTDGTNVSYDQWGIGATSSSSVTFVNGYRKDSENAWYEQSIVVTTATTNLDLVEKVTYGRDYKIRYALSTVTADMSVPAPKYATESASYTFAFIAEDLSDAPVYTGSGTAPTWDNKWYIDEDCTTEATIGGSITKDITLYCKFI